mmetsp:Transcript_19159/g.38765  ORF Transcript_19159/g.38765 Transcript_19159/m.38765 type:complete len:211 (+) Transcript_19159:638-1270(+)
MEIVEKWSTPTKTTPMETINPVLISFPRRGASTTRMYAIKSLNHRQLWESWARKLGFLPNLQLMNILNSYPIMVWSNQTIVNCWPLCLNDPPRGEITARRWKRPTIAQPPMEWQNELPTTTRKRNACLSPDCILDTFDRQTKTIALCSPPIVRGTLPTTRADGCQTWRQICITYISPWIAKMDPTTGQTDTARNSYETCGTRQMPQNHTS